LQFDYEVIGFGSTENTGLARQPEILAVTDAVGGAGDNRAGVAA
jgi:hypothetical protein